MALHRSRLAVYDPYQIAEDQGVAEGFTGCARIAIFGGEIFPANNAL